MKTKSKGSLVKRGSNYYAMWRCGVDGKPKQFCQVLRNEDGAPCTTQREAEAAKAKLMRLFVKGDEQETLRNIQARIETRTNEIADLTPATLIAEAWQAFASPTSGRKPCEASTLDTYENIWAQFQKWIESEHPNVKTLRAVTYEIAKEHLDSLITRGLSNGTFNVHLSLLRYVFKTLKRAARLKENVWTEFRRLQTQCESRRELTIDELTKVCTAAKGEMRTLFCIGMYSGLRLGDCATLKWNEVDLKRDLIRRIPNKIRRKKGANGLKQISIHPVLRGVLESLPDSKTEGYVLPESADSYLSNRSLLVGKIQRHFEHCGIETTKERDNGVRRAVTAGYHSLRHSFVSIHALNNVPLTVVQSLVGHASIGMTEHYSHSNLAAEQAAIAAMPAIAF